jgi:hypothetical protein
MREQRRLFGPKKDEVRGEWRRIHNKKHFDTIRVIKSRIMEWAEHVTCMVDWVLMRRSDEKGPLERPRRRW